MSEVRATLDAVATAAGVSRMTVSNVYGKPGVVAPATRERVLAAAEALGYGGPSPVGRTLRRGTTNVLGLLLSVGLPDAFADPAAAEFLRGVAQGCDEADLSLQIVHASGRSARDRVNDAAVDCFIAWSLAEDDAALLAALDRRLPVVSFGGTRKLAEVPYVSADNVGGARAAALHLTERGVRRFAVVECRTRSQEFVDRIAGWRNALEGSGVEWDTVIRLEQPSNSRANGRSAARAFLESFDPGDRWGILTMTDVLGLGLLAELRAAGVRVPEDIAVVGFDDIEEAASSSPGLTTIRQDIAGLGRECALRAARRLDAPLEPRPTALVVRGSSDPDAGSQARVGAT